MEARSSTSPLHLRAAHRGASPLLKLQGDERLVALTRRGNHGAYETLVARYQARLLAFCRHMLASREDAEDVLQEVFAAAFNAMVADDRPINVRPWLYRIARNRCLNHLRRQTAIGVDSMDTHVAAAGESAADQVHKREEFRQLISDVGTLPETQRTALLLREIDALSYEQIAEAMETTIPSVKSLLVRARVSLAEAAEARKLSCSEVREELGEWAEGLQRISPPVRRHLRGCERCSAFRKQLDQTNKALAAVFPLGPLLLLKKFLLAQGAGASAAGAGVTAASAGASAAGSVAAGGALTAGASAIASKAAAGLAAAAIVTAGAVEVEHVQRAKPERTDARKAIAPPPPAVAAAPPVVVESAPQPAAAAPPAVDDEEKARKPARTSATTSRRKDEDAPAASTTATTPQPATTSTVTTPAPAPATTTPQKESDATTLPQEPASEPAATQPAPATTAPQQTTTQPTTTSTTPSQTQPPPATTSSTPPPSEPEPQPAP